MSWYESGRVRRGLTGGAVAILLFFLIRYALESRWALVGIDTPVALVGIALFNLWWRRMKQDNLSYAAFLLMLVLHVAYLYPYAPLGISWDHYMHFIAGAALALMAHRILRSESWGPWQFAAFIVLFAVGIGAIHEIVEWLGYAFLGSGEGFLLYGAGDEGEWRNAILDMSFNLFGSLSVAITTWRTRKNHS